MRHVLFRVASPVRVTCSRQCACASSLVCSSPFARRPLFRRQRFGNLARLRRPHGRLRRPYWRLRRVAPSTHWLRRPDGSADPMGGCQFHRMSGPGSFTDGLSNCQRRPAGLEGNLAPASPHTLLESVVGVRLIRPLFGDSGEICLRGRDRRGSDTTSAMGIVHRDFAGNERSVFGVGGHASFFHGGGSVSRPARNLEDRLRDQHRRVRNEVYCPNPRALKPPPLRTGKRPLLQAGHARSPSSTY